MDEYNVNMDEYDIIETKIERAEEISRRTLDAIPSSNSYFPASVSSIVDQVKYRQEIVTYGKQKEETTFKEIKRETYKDENQNDILEIVYEPRTVSGETISSYITLPKVQEEYNKAISLGFKGNIEEYIRVRDYT